ncbi:MAG: HAD family hydrolase [Gammaproteobacteria bacterium]
MSHIIKLVCFDVDGVLTDGRIHLDAQGNELKIFHTQDGLGIKRLLQHGVAVAIISGRTSAQTTQRMRQLGVEYVYQGHDDKLTVYQELLTTLNLSDEQVAHVGDDLPDLPLMQRAGLGIAVANAVDVVKQHADWVTQRAGGEGAAREVCEEILRRYYAN